MKLNKIMKNLKDKQFKVVRVDANEFELDNGDTYPIPFDLDEIPSVEEFQELLEGSKDSILELIENINVQKSWTNS